MKRTFMPIIVILLLALAACGRVDTPGPATSESAPVSEPPTAVSEPPTAVSEPPTAVSEPTAAGEATEVPPTAVPPTAVPATDAPATDVPVAAAGDTSPLFGTAWTDRSPYAAGLIASQQGLLDERPGAPVYHMQLDIADTMTTIDGRQAVYYTNTEDVALDAIYFHLFPNLLDGAIDIHEVLLDGQPVAPALEGPNDTLLRVPLATPLAPGDTAVIEIAFTTTPPTDIGRNYGIFAYYDDVLTLAHFYPMLAVYDAEGWAIATPDVQGDVTYSDAGYYLVEVTAPEDQQLVGGGIVTDSTSSDGRQTVTFAAGPMRDFYMVASDDYLRISDTVDGVQINSYGPAAYPEGVRLALDVAARTLANHSEWLAPYPYTELDIVATPTSALGVEYPGIFANTERMYDIDAQAASGVPWRVILESTTAHEMGHQWFYGLVGNDQLNEPWLDEALTQYATYRYYLSTYGPPGGEGYFDSLLGRWERVDGAEIPIGLPVADYEEAEYGAIVYGRGPVFVRALAEEMGQDAFDAFLRDYVATYRLDIATAEQFRALAESHCDCDLSPLFAEWVDR